MERRKFTREFKLEAVRLIRDRGVSYAQAEQDLAVHQSQLRSWVKAFADDPAQAFPGQGQMKPEGRRVRLHRTLLQSETSALDDRLYESYGMSPMEFERQAGLA
jgi:transposase